MISMEVGHRVKRGRVSQGPRLGALNTRLNVFLEDELCPRHFTCHLQLVYYSRFYELGD